MKEKFPMFKVGYLSNWFDFIDPVSDPQDRISIIGTVDDNFDYVLIVKFCGGLYTITFPLEGERVLVRSYIRTGHVSDVISFPFKKIGRYRITNY